MSETTINLSLTVADGNAALDFYTRAFGATELYRMTMPGGGVAHSEFQIGKSTIYLSEEYPAWQAKAMLEGEVASCLFAIDVEDCDTAFQTAVEAGAKPGSEPENQPWGWRTAMVIDPFGYRWNLRHLVEDLTPKEVMRRFQEMMNQPT